FRRVLFRSDISERICAQHAAGHRPLERQRGDSFRNIFDLYVEGQRVLLEPAQAGIRGGPAILVFAEARDGAVVDDFTFGITPAAGNDLIDRDFVDIACDYAVYELRSVAAGNAILEGRRDVDEPGGIADGVVFVL